MSKRLYCKGSGTQFIMFFALVSLTVSLMILAIFFDTFPGDQWLMVRISSYNNPGINFTATFFNHIGSRTGFVLSVIPLIVGFWIFGKKHYSITFTAMIFVHILAFILKFMIDRPRPLSILHEISSESASFPSSHAIHSVLFFGFIGYISWPWVRSSTLRLVMALVIFIAIILVGIARIHVGAHWPSDVLGGYAYGAVFLWILIWISKLQISNPNENNAL